MKHVETKARRGFSVLCATRSSQAAMMTLRPGETSGETAHNEHAWAEQWLYVVAGTGVARVGARRVKLHAGSLVLIGKRERHQIENTGRTNLVTFNVYAPPAYRRDGEPLRD